MSARPLEFAVLDDEQGEGEAMAVADLIDLIREMLRFAPGGIDEVPELQGPAVKIWLRAWDAVHAFDAEKAER